MATTEPLLSIGEVAARAGLRTSHIRYYERVGVLPLPDRLGGQRRYHPEVLHRLAIVDVAQRAGFTLEEIRELTGPQPPGHAAGERLRELAQCKRPDIEALIQRAQAVKRWLEIASACDCATVDACSLFTDPALAPPAADGGVPRYCESIGVGTLRPDGLASPVYTE